MTGKKATEKKESSPGIEKSEESKSKKATEKKEKKKEQILKKFLKVRKQHGN